jgi:hypothetical protein
MVLKKDASILGESDLSSANAMDTPHSSMITAAYLEHLTAADLRLLHPDRRPTEAREVIMSAGRELEKLLGSTRVFESVFSGSDTGDPLLAASPFLVFSVAVHRSAADLASASYVSEWLGLGRRAPVFDVAQLREFMAAPWHRLFLIELLASYTHVSSGSVLVQTRRGFRRQRFSELDPVRLAALLDVVSAAERPGVLRRLGDVALFLTGVFPDHVARRGFGPIEEGRLIRSSGRAAGREMTPSRDPRNTVVGDRGAVGLLEQLGRRWYRAAFASLPHPIAENVAVIGELPERFDEARRMLGYVTEHFLFPHRDKWFGLSGG